MKRLDEAGCNVIAGCLSEKGETALKKSCSSRLKTVSLDVANSESVKRAFLIVSKLLPEGQGILPELINRMTYEWNAQH